MTKFRRGQGVAIFTPGGHDSSQGDKYCQPSRRCKTVIMEDRNMSAGRPHSSRYSIPSFLIL